MIHPNYLFKMRNIVHISFCFVLFICSVNSVYFSASLYFPLFFTSSSGVEFFPKLEKNFSPEGKKVLGSEVKFCRSL
jgi:hypothetical protein